MNTLPNFHDSCHNRKDCKKFDTCPMILVHKLISGKWKILIIWYLCGGSLRFTDLKKKLPNVKKKMLTNQLRSLEEDGLVHREVFPVVPPKVEYSLTDMGQKMIPLLEQMYDYGIEYEKNVEK